MHSMMPVSRVSNRRSIMITSTAMHTGQAIELDPNYAKAYYRYVLVNPR